MPERSEFYPKLLDMNGKEILPGSEIRLNESGKEKFSKIFKRIYEEMPNFRCRVTRITSDGIIYALPTETSGNELIEYEKGKYKKLSEHEFPFLPREVIVEQ